MLRRRMTLVVVAAVVVLLTAACPTDNTDPLAGSPVPGGSRASAEVPPSPVAAEDSAPAEDLGPRTNRNISYPVTVSGRSGSVGVNTQDCFGETGPIDQCPDEVDIAGMSWGPVDGSPDLLKLTVSFVGPFAGPIATRVNIGLFSDGPSMGTNVSLVDGNVTCTFPGTDGPLEGESCALNAAGEIELVRDVSGMNRIRVLIRSRQGSGDSRIGDAVQIRGIERP